MYSKILKEETEKIVFQYLEELKNTLVYKKTTIDDFLKDIEIDIEAQESYDYYSLIIDNHFKKPLVNKEGMNPNYLAFYEEFYASVKKAFIEELRLLESNYLSEISENQEDLDYFAERKYLTEVYFSKTGQITEEERNSLIKEYKKEIAILEGQLKILRRAF